MNYIYIYILIIKDIFIDKKEICFCNKINTYIKTYLNKTLEKIITFSYI